MATPQVFFGQGPITNQGITSYTSTNPWGTSDSAIDYMSKNLGMSPAQLSALFNQSVTGQVPGAGIHQVAAPTVPNMPTADVNAYNADIKQLMGTLGLQGGMTPAAGTSFQMPTAPTMPAPPTVGAAPTMDPINIPTPVLQNLGLQTTLSQSDLNNIASGGGQLAQSIMNQMNIPVDKLSSLMGVMQQYAPYQQGSPGNVSMAGTNTANPNNIFGQEALSSIIGSLAPILPQLAQMYGNVGQYGQSVVGNDLAARDSANNALINATTQQYNAAKNQAAETTAQGDYQGKLTGYQAQNALQAAQYGGNVNMTNEQYQASVQAALASQQAQAQIMNTLASGGMSGLNSLLGMALQGNINAQTQGLQGAQQLANTQQAGWNQAYQDWAAESAANQQNLVSSMLAAASQQPKVDITTTPWPYAPTQITGPGYGTQGSPWNTNSINQNIMAGSTSNSDPWSTQKPNTATPGQKTTG